MQNNFYMKVRYGLIAKRWWLFCLFLAAIFLFGATPNQATAATIKKLPQFDKSVPASEVFITNLDLRKAVFTRTSGGDGAKFNLETWRYHPSTAIYGQKVPGEPSIILYDSFTGTRTYNNPFSLRFNGAGFTSSGEEVDVRLNFTKITRHNKTEKGITSVMYWEPNILWLDSRCYPTGSSNGGRYEFDVDIYHAGTNKLMDKSAQIVFKDLDVRDWTKESDQYAPTNPYIEAIKFGRGFEDEFYLTNTSLLRTSESNTRFSGTQEDDATENSSVVGYLKAGTGSLVWTGTRCATQLLGGEMRPRVPAPEPTIEKSVDKEVMEFSKEDLLTYSFETWFPYTSASAAPKAITLTDALPSCFDMEETTVTVYAVEGEDRRDVTEEWTIEKSALNIVSATVSGQQKTAQVAGDYEFEVATHLDTESDMTTFDKGDHYLVENIAVLDYDEDAITSNEVETKIFEVEEEPEEEEPEPELIPKVAATPKPPKNSVVPKTPASKWNPKTGDVAGIAGALCLLALAGACIAKLVQRKRCNK